MMKRAVEENRLVGMRRNTARSLRPGVRGLDVRCDSGLLIVTQTGDRKDHELHSGDVFRTSRRGRVVVWAIWASHFTSRTFGMLELLPRAPLPRAA